MQRWEYDVRELQVAEEEGMEGPQPVTLDAVLRALRTWRSGGYRAIRTDKARGQLTPTFDPNEQATTLRPPERMDHPVV